MESWGGWILLEDGRSSRRQRRRTDLLQDFCPYASVFKLADCSKAAVWPARTGSAFRTRGPVTSVTSDHRWAEFCRSLVLIGTACDLWSEGVGRLSHINPRDSLG